MYNWRVAKSYSIAQARAHLPDLVDRVEAGDDIELTRRGRPVACLISRRELARLRAATADFAAAYEAFLARHPDREGLPEGFLERAWESESDRDP